MAPGDNYNVWTVTLKPNYHFSDGTRVTAELVATCLQELNDKDEKAANARASVGVMTVTAESELVVKIESNRSTHIMDSVLAEWIFTIYYKTNKRGTSTSSRGRTPSTTSTRTLST